MTRVRATFAIALSALAFTACGGGGDDEPGGNNCTTNPTAPGCGTGNANTAPTAKANGPYSSVAGGTISFSASGSSDAQDATTDLTYAWDFGDGTSAAGFQVSHVYTAANTYTATLKVTDKGGASATATAPVQITAAPTPPAGAQVGTMGIVLTDLPFVYDSVASAPMFVVRVDARFAEPTTAAEVSSAVTGDPNSGWVTVVAPNQAYDVLALQSGITRALGSKTDMPAGSYRGFRIVLDVAQSNIALLNGTKPAINWGGATGQAFYKITPAEPVAIAANGVNNVTVDFDLGRSFSSVGPSPAAGFVAVPNLRTIGSTQRGTFIGRPSVNGNNVAPGITVELLTAGTAVDDLSRDKIVSTAVTKADGVFTMVHIQPGTYTARFTFPARYNVSPQVGPATIAAPSTSRASNVQSFEFQSPR